jgi:hypothetical protein
VNIEQNHIINAIYKLGYDGLCCFGNEKNILGKDFHNAENIGIFDPTDVRIISRGKNRYRRIYNSERGS